MKTRGILIIIAGVSLVCVGTWAHSISMMGGYSLMFAGVYVVRYAAS
jgi:uncharacterized membrane protein